MRFPAWLASDRAPIAAAPALALAGALLAFAPLVSAPHAAAEPWAGEDQEQLEPPDPPGDGLPELPPAGEMPDPQDCEVEAPTYSPRIVDYCELRRLCAAEGEKSAELERRCAALREREMLRRCQLASDTTEKCRQLYAGLKARCGDPEFYEGHADACIESQRGPPRPPFEDESGGDPDFLGSNGGRSPWCDRANLPHLAQANCRATGSISRDFPEASYAIDARGEGLDGIDVHLLLIQVANKLIWWVLLVLVENVLLLLEWAFSLDLLGSSCSRGDGTSCGNAMPDLEVILVWVHEDLLGQPWTLAALTIAGLWGIWNGLVRQRTIATLGGLLATVLLMVVGLILIENPRGTVGRASHWANEGAVGALEITGKGGGADSSYAHAHLMLFEQLVREPWCALQFGDVSYCDQDTPDRLVAFCRAYEREHPGFRVPCVGTVAEFWLRSPCKIVDRLGNCDEDRGGKWAVPRDEYREELAQWYVDNGLEAKIAPQSTAGAISRFGLLALIAGGVLGAIFLLVYLGVNLIAASAMTILLLLFLPLVFLAPAFGEAGRRLFTTWLKRLAGVVLAKFFYGLFLAFVLLTAGLIASMDLGWWPKWIILFIFWWGVFARRQQIVGFASLTGEAPAGAAGLGLFKAYLGWRMFSDLTRPARRLAGAPLRGLWRGTKLGAGTILRRTRDSRIARAEGREAAAGLDAQTALSKTARDDVAKERKDAADDASGTLKRMAKTRRGLGKVRQKLGLARGRRGEIDRELGSLEQQKRSLRDKLARNTERKAKAQSDLNGLEFRLAAVRRELTHGQPSTARRIQLEGQQEQLGQQKAHLEGVIRTVDAARPGLQQQVLDADAQTTTLGTERAALEQQMSALQLQETKLNEDLALGAGEERQANDALRKHAQGVSDADVRSKIAEYEAKLAASDPRTETADDKRLRRLVELSRGRGTEEMFTEQEYDAGLDRHKGLRDDRASRWDEIQRAARDKAYKRRRRGSFR